MRFTVALDVMAELVAVAGVYMTSLETASIAGNETHFNLMSGPWRGPKRRWFVKTESHVRREKRKRPDPPCVICKGAGRITCRRCQGRGRTNFVEVAMLPKGEWPKWCVDCRGSGLGFCGRCLGSGERRGVIGFHIPEEEETIINPTGCEARSSIVVEKDVCETR